MPLRPLCPLNTSRPRPTATFLRAARGSRRCRSAPLRRPASAASARGRERSGTRAARRTGLRGWGGATRVRGALGLAGSRSARWQGGHLARPAWLLSSSSLPPFPALPLVLLVQGAAPQPRAARPFGLPRPQLPSHPCPRPLPPATRKTTPGCSRRWWRAALRSRPSGTARGSGSAARRRRRSTGTRPLGGGEGQRGGRGTAGEEGTGGGPPQGGWGRAGVRREDMVPPLRTRASCPPFPAL